MGVTVTQGTQTVIKSTTDGGNGEIQHVRMDGGTLPVGTFVHPSGTITAGTVTALANGTITNGTVQTYGIRHPDAFATIISVSGTALGTVKAAVAGSAHYITDMLISVNDACVTALYAGSTLVRSGTHYFNSNGGLINNLNTPITIDAGSEITFRHIGTGLATLELRGYID